MMNRKGRPGAYFFALFPGCGQMYLGFMKQGVSLLVWFFGIIFMVSWMRLGPIAYLLPIIWQYSFFDAINKNALSDEAFSRLEDRYLLFLMSLS